MNNLKQLRRSKRWTQTIAAEHLQIARAEISRIERSGDELDLKLQARVEALFEAPARCVYRDKNSVKVPRN